MSSTPDSQVKYNHDSLGFLREVGRELTADAEKGKLKAVVGREREIQMMIETLCRETKSNPVLVGAAGVGKTALVEGLAILISKGKVPQKLRDCRLFSVSASALIAGCNWYGMIETRIKYLLEEAKKDKVLVFIDEIHTIVGTAPDAGDSTRDIAQQLKPALSRGEIKLIGATTDVEYSRFIAVDEALERRFQPINVPELTADQTLEILKDLAKGYSSKNKIEVGENILRLILTYGERFLRNRHLPDKAIDLLEQTVGYAESKDKMRVTAEDAKQVVQRIVGMPPDIRESLQMICEDLMRKELFDEIQSKQFCDFLRVSLQGLSLNPERPNAVVFLAGESAKDACKLAEIISEDLFGAKDRVIKLNFAGLGERWELNQMLGIETGLRRQSSDAPIAVISKMSWCVIVCEGLETAGLPVQEIWARAIENGFLTDAHNKKIYLSDTIIIVSADVDVSAKSKMGFNVSATSGKGDEQTSDRLEKYFSRSLIKFADFIVLKDEMRALNARRQWLKENLHNNLTQRFRRQGIYLHWDKSIIESLSQKLEELDNEQKWERLVNFEILPALLPFLEQIENRLSLLVSCRNGEIDIESAEVSENAEQQIKLEESLKRELYGKIVSWLKGLFCIETQDDFSMMSVYEGTTRVDVYFSFWKERMMLSLLTQFADKAEAGDASFAAYILEKNMKLRFGKFAVETDGSVWLEYSMFGEHCDAQNFLAVLRSITETARQYKEDLRKRETTVITSQWLSDEAVEWLESRRMKKRK